MPVLELMETYTTDQNDIVLNSKDKAPYFNIIKSSSSLQLKDLAFQDVFCKQSFTNDSAQLPCK